MCLCVCVLHSLQFEAAVLYGWEPGWFGSLLDTYTHAQQGPANEYIKPDFLFFMYASHSLWFEAAVLYGQKPT